MGRRMISFKQYLNLMEVPILMGSGESSEYRRSSRDEINQIAVKDNKMIFGGINRKIIASRGKWNLVDASNRFSKDFMLIYLDKGKVQSYHYISKTEENFIYQNEVIKRRQSDLDSKTMLEGMLWVASYLGAKGIETSDEQTPGGNKLWKDWLGYALDKRLEIGFENNGRRTKYTGIKSDYWKFFVDNKVFRSINNTAYIKI